MHSRINRRQTNHRFYQLVHIQAAVALLAIVLVTNGLWACDKMAAKQLDPSLDSPLLGFSSRRMPLPTVGDLSDRSRDKNIIAIAWGVTDPALTNLKPKKRVILWDSPATIASHMKSMPKGSRVIYPHDLSAGLLIDPRDVCRMPEGHPTTSRGIWPVRGLRDVRQNFDRFFSQFKAAGGEVDYVIFDIEKGYRWPSIRVGGYQRIDAIENDPRFPPVAALLGYSDLSEVESDFETRLRWDAVMEGWRVKYMNIAIADVIQEYFPDAVVSNYNSFLIDEENAVPHYSGRLEYKLGEGFGTHDAAKFYGIIGAGLARKRLDGINALGDSPYAGVLVYVNKLRAIRRSSDRPFQPWIVGYSHTRSATEPDRRMVISKSPHYDDFVFQMGVHGNREIIVWNIKQSETGETGTYSTPADDVRLDNLIREMNQKLAGQWGKTVTLDMVPWGSRIIASGLHVDDRIVWRLTVDKGINTVVVKVNGQMQRLEREPNRQGLWFVHPADQSFEVLRLE